MYFRLLRIENSVKKTPSKLQARIAISIVKPKTSTERVTVNAEKHLLGFLASGMLSEVY